MIEPLITLGLLQVLQGFGVNIAAAAAFEWIAAKWKTAGVTNHDLQKALRESYCDALSSIEFGFRRREGLLDSLGKRRLYREITASFDKEFLTPFISETSLSQDELESLAREGAKYCRILREAVDLLLPKEDVPNITIENLLLTGRKLEGADDLRKLNDKAKADLMTKVRSVEGVPKFFFDFLDYKDLLMGSMVFFYGERIKADERVRSILTHAELQRIREEQSKQYQKQAAKLETALQSQMSAFQQFLSPIKDNFAEVLTCLERLEAEWAETTRYLQRILDLISLDKGLSDKDKRQLEAGLSPSFDLHAKYEFDERKPIGYGAVATVYRALHRGLRQVRAIKVLKPEHRENQEVVERFLREAVVLGSLKHANIVQIYDAGGGGPNLDFYLEMEYVEGVTLRNFIKTHEFDWQRILKFIKQLGSAIQKMHESGIIHRDLNPRNIMVDKNGDLKVMDFGVAKIVGVEGLTKDGQVVGTTDYIAPEQARGERVDERADIYSLGVILYELCTRRLPSTPALPLRQYEPSVPEWLEDIVGKCLKQDRNLRYANMKEVLAALEKRELEVLRKTEVKEAPLLSIACERLDFTNVKAGSRIVKSFNVNNARSGRLTGKITTTQPWLKVSPDTIDLEREATKVQVTVDTAGLPLDFQGLGVIDVATNGGEGRVTISLSTTVTERPQVPGPARETRRSRVLLAVFVTLGLAILILIVGRIGPDILERFRGGESPVGTSTFVSGSKIAFVSDRDGNNEIYVMDITGNQLRRLTHNSASDTSPTFSPDGTKIAFQSNRTGDWEIYSMNVDDNSQTQLTKNSNFWPIWLPHNDKIAFRSTREHGPTIYIMNPDGSNQTLIAHTSWEYLYSWSPDGANTVFSLYGEIYVVNIDSIVEQQLTHTSQTGFSNRSLYSPQWSPSGDKIAFVDDKEVQVGYKRWFEIWVMNTDGSNLTLLVEDYDCCWGFEWSPDSRKIAFASNRDGNREIYIINVDGSNQTRLTSNKANDYAPTWSPDGIKIAFVSDRDGNSEIYVMNSDGSNQRNLTNNAAQDRFPVWAPR